MAELKPYASLTSISDLSLPFSSSISPRLHTPISLLRLSHSNPIPSSRQLILCAAGKRGWSQSSNRKILQLASTLAFNLRILPEPLNSLVGEIARGGSNSNDHRILNRLVGGLTGKPIKRKKRGTKFIMWLVFGLMCVAGLWSWKVSDLELFLRSLFFSVVGISLWRGNKAIKVWFLGLISGIVLMVSFRRMGKEDVNFWVQKLKNCSPPVVTQIVIRNRNRNRNRKR